MALSLLQQHSSFSDFQSIFDPIQQQQRSHSVITPFDPLNCINADQMEYNAISNNSSNNNNNNNSLNQQSVIGNYNNNNNNNNVGHSSGSGGVEDTNHFISGLIHQHLNNSNRGYVSGYHHHHISNDYEQVINFVDSPPNSEESWTDEHSKGSPGPQIIEVQTICSNSGSRKRRMDWDSLDICQSGNTISAAQNGEVANKIPHLRGNPSDGQNSSSQQQEKEKQKKEKSGRGSWTDEIDFDLNAEFSSNSYLNNETFLSFSPALTVLKQEPQSEQQLKEIKSSTVCVSKIDKPIVDTSIDSNPKQKQKNDLNETVCGCGSPQSSQPGFEQNLRVEKVSTNVTENDMSHNTGGVNADKTKSRQSSPAIQQAESVAATSLSDDHKFQYILAAATSIATKNNEETLTYLNQGQSYEIKLKKTGDLSFYRDKILKSVIKICFHERRLQYMEREQMQQWQASRPGERIIEVDVPLSYGLCHVSQPLSSNFLSTVEVFWDPLKEVGVYIKVNCISTEFTPKKHGGEKGVPFKLQIETYIENTNSPNVTASAASSPLPSTGGSTTSVIAANLAPSNGNNSKQPVHAAACQIKVFKLKGADRKHKQDREKIQKRPQSEQDKFQPSYECTIMNDIPLDLIIPSSGCFSPEYMKVWPNSPVHIPKYDGILPYTSTSPASNSSPIAINSVTSSNSPTLKLMDTNMVSPQQVPSDLDDYVMNIMPDATPAQVTQWLTYHRLTLYITTFAHFSGADILRMSKEDLIQICGLADGIRMFNILRAKMIAPRLTIYVSMDGSSYNAIYLISNTAKELMQKLYKLAGFYEFIANNGNTRSIENGAIFNSWGMQSKYSGSGSNIFNDVAKTSIYITGPSGVHVTVSDEVLNNEIKDGSLYALEVQNGKILMKLIIKNDN